MDENCVNWKENVEFKLILHAYSTELPIISYALSRKLIEPLVALPLKTAIHIKNTYFGSKPQNCVLRAGKGARQMGQIGLHKIIANNWLTRVHVPNT